MKFSDIVDQASDRLQRAGRVSYRALTRDFGLDADTLEDLKEELIDIREVGADKDGKMLVWTGDGTTPPQPARSQPQAEQGGQTMAGGSQRRVVLDRSGSCGKRHKVEFTGGEDGS